MTKKQTEWPPSVHRGYAERDGRSPEDFRHDQWPVSNILIEHPGYQVPREISLCYFCDIPASTPQANQYDENNNPLPDPVGMALARVKFILYEAHTNNKLDEEVVSGHSEGKVQGMVAAQEDNTLWQRLTPGTSIQVFLTAIPLFYFLTEDGAAMLAYAVSNHRGYFAGEPVVSRIYTLTLTQEGVLLIDGEQAEQAPEIRDEESFAEYDRVVAAEKAERERQARELEDRLAKEKREREEQWAREDAEREAERKKAEAEAEAERKRNEKYIQRGPAQTPVEEKKQVLTDLFNAQFKGLLGTDQDGNFVDIGDKKFKEVCLRARGMGDDWRQAVDLIAAERGWTL